MDNKQIIGHYYNIKKQYLKSNPFYCLIESNIDTNPHQVDALIFALSHLKNGGVILADEVGLGKTIEAGLIIKYHIMSGRNKVLLIIPSTIRKQWQIELEQKFSINVTILDADNLKDNIRYAEHSKDRPVVLICSYNFASKYAHILKEISWDLTLVDEAHKLRNVHKPGVKRAKDILQLTFGIPKILLTATPIQNNLFDIYGLLMFIDERILFDKRPFYLKYVRNKNYEELKEAINHIVKRTLRKDVADYLTFRSRASITVDFKLSHKEVMLYEMVNQYLKKVILFAIPPSNRNLITIVIRKLLASSSYAVVDTFHVLKSRLEILKESTHEVSAEKSLDFFFEFIDEDESSINYDENSDRGLELFDRERVNDFIQHEIDDIDDIISLAGSINENSKGTALIKALEIGFGKQKERNIPEKVVIFTESVRTQQYLYELLRDNGYSDEIIIFNETDNQSRKIYKAWKAKNFGRELSNRSVEMKQAIVNYFEDNCKILLVTDIGSEGLNLQFCNTVINYDLPWNPQKIEQRIGRCHRYGQKNDVLVLNLLNTQNVADRRVYELLSCKLKLFEGVFGTSDQALGLIESGQNFEKRILQIYQNCNTTGEFNKEFNELEKEFERKRNKSFQQLKNLFGSFDERNKSQIYSNIKSDIEKYIKELEVSNKKSTHKNITSELRMNGHISNNCKIKLSNGLIIIGAIILDDQNIEPTIIIKDQKLGYLKDEVTVLDVIEHTIGLKDVNFNKKDMKCIEECKEVIYRDFMLEYYKKYNEVIIYEKSKIDNWSAIKKDFYNMTFEMLESEISKLRQQSLGSKDFKEKIQFGKLIKEKEQKRNKMMESYHEEVLAIDKEAEQMKNAFEEALNTSPKMNLSIVIKYNVRD